MTTPFERLQAARQAMVDKARGVEPKPDEAADASAVEAWKAYEAADRWQRARIRARVGSEVIERGRELASK